MAGDAVAAQQQSLPRPQLKGRHATFMKKHLAISIGISLVAVYLTKVFVNDKRKAAYAEFYRYVLAIGIMSMEPAMGLNELKNMF